MMRHVFPAIVIACPLFASSWGPAAVEIADLLMGTSVMKMAIRGGRCPALDEGSIVGPFASFRLVERCRQGQGSIFSQVITLDLRDGSMFSGLDEVKKRISFTSIEKSKITRELHRIKLSPELAAQQVGTEKL